MSSPISNIQHQNNQPITPIHFKASALTISVSQGISSSQLDIKSIAISSIQKEQMRSFMKTCGFDDAWIQTVKEENLQSIEHLADCIFSHILNEMISEEWKILSYDHLLELYDLQGMNLAFAAIREGNKEFFSYLINQVPENDLMKLKGLEEREDLKGKTLLHLTAIYGREEMLEVLLHRGSGIVNIKDKDALGLTALHWAIHEGHEGVLQKLLDYGMMGQDWEFKKHAISIIALAVASGYPNVLVLLLKHNQFKEISLLDAIPNVKTVLHLAIHLNKPKMLEYLLNHEHDSIKHLLEIKDAYGRTPLQLAAFLGDLFAIRALVNKGVHIHKGEFENFGTALHFAVKGKQPDAITLLLSLGVDPHKTDEVGKAPLAYLQGEEAEYIIIKRCKNILENFIASKRLEKVKVIDFNERAPFNLILEGSYQQKEGFTGIIKGLESKKILKNIKRFSGLGMGGIIATLLALGYTASQIEELPFDSFQDLFTIDPSLTHSQLKELETLYFSNSSEEKKSASILSLCQIEMLRSNLEEMISHNVEIENLTLKELAEKVKRYPERYKHIHLSAYSSKAQKTIQFTSEDPKYGDFLLSDVLTATLAFPGIFKPLTLRRKNSEGDPYDDTIYGKMSAPSLANSLVDQFDDSMYQEDPYFKGKQTNYRTLLLKLDYQLDQKNQVAHGKEFLSKLIHFYLDKVEKRITSEEVSRGRIKMISFLEGEDDHITAAEKQIGLHFSSGKKSLGEKNTSSISLEFKNHLSPWKYTLFLKGNRISSESFLPKQPSCINTIPHREIFFTGRVKELSELKAQFMISSKVAIAGLGGMGKSTLSFKYVSELAGYRFIHFIKATAPGAVRSGLIELATLLGMKKENHEETLDELKAYFQQMVLPGMIIVDGADDESFFKELSDYVPHSKKCHILISTRIGDKAKVNGFHVISLKEFSKEEAVYYLTKVDKSIQKEQQTAERLAAAVGYHPLAFSHIARYLGQEKISLCKYEERFKERNLKLLSKDGINLPIEEASVFITWQVSLDAISKKDNGFLAIEMMKMIALLGEEDIPFDLLHTWAKRYHPNEDDISILEAIKLLKDYTFFQEKTYEFDRQKYYQIHSLIQKVTAYQLELSEKSRSLQEAVVALNQEITELRRPHRMPNRDLDKRLKNLYQVHAVNLYEIDGKHKILPTLEYIQLLSHLGWDSYNKNLNKDKSLSYIDQGIKLGKELPNGSESLVIAELYNVKSRLRNNEQLGRESLKIRENILGKTSEYTVESYDNLSTILNDLSKIKESLLLRRQVLEIRRKNLGEGNYWTSWSYTQVIDLLKELGQEKEALSVAQKMLATRREALGEGDEWTSSSYIQVIDLLKELGRKEEALSVAQKMLATRREELGEGDEWTSWSYTQVIDLLKKLGQEKEALSVAQKMLAARREALGEGDKWTSWSYTQVIDLLNDLGQKEKALSVAQKILAIRREALGEEHEWTSESYIQVIDILKELGQEEEALSVAQKMLATRREELGEGDEWTSWSYTQVIDLLKELGQKEESLFVAQKMLATRRETLGEGDEWTFKSYIQMIDILKELGQKEEALSVAQEMLATRRDALGEGDGWTFKSYIQVIDILKELGQEEEALSVAQEMLATRREALGEGDEWTVESYAQVIDLLKELGKKEEALFVAQKMLATRREALGEGDEWTFKSYIQVIDLLKELGKKEEALSVAQKMLAIRREALGEGDERISESYIQAIDVLKELGKKEEALSVAQKMLATRREALGEGDEWTSESYRIVIGFLKELGQEEEALSVAKEMLATRRETLGEGDEWISKSYGIVIDLLKELGQEEEAFSVAKETLATRREALGEGDWRTSESYTQVIDLLKELGQKEEALAVAQKMLATRREALGEGDAWTSESYIQVIDLLKELGQKEEALAVAQKMLGTRREALGENNEWTSKSYDSMIQLFKEFKGAQETLSIAQKVLQSRQEKSPKNSTCILESYYSIGCLFQDLEQFDKALEAFEILAEVNVEKLQENFSQNDKEMSLKKLGMPEPNELQKETIYGAVFYQTEGKFLKILGQSKKALEAIQKALMIKQKFINKDSIHIANSYQLLGSIFYDLKNYKEALINIDMALTTIDEGLKVENKYALFLAENYELKSAIFYNLKDYQKAFDCSIEAEKFRDLVENEEASFYKIFNYGFGLILLKKLKNDKDYLQTKAELLKIKNKILSLQHEHDRSNASQKKGEYRKFILILEKILLNQRIVLGENSIYSMLAKEFIYEIFYKIEDYSNALVNIESVLALKEKLFEKESAFISESYLFKSRILRDLKQFDKALENATKALEINKIVDNNLPQVAENYLIIGQILQKIGSFNEALENAEKALKINIELDDNLPQIAENYLVISQILQSLWQFNKALENAKKALELNGNLDGKTSQTAESHLRIAIILQDLEIFNSGKIDSQEGILEALKHIENALRIYDSLGERSLNTAKSHACISAILQSLKKPIQALEHGKHALKIYQDLLGKESFQVAESLLLNSKIFQDLGQIDQALEASETALNMISKQYGKESHHLAENYESVSKLLDSLGRYDDALKMINKALEIRVKIIDVKSLTIATTYDIKVSIFQHLNQYDNALKYAEKALEIRKKASENREKAKVNLYYSIAKNYEVLAVILRNLKQYGRAIKFIQSSINIINEDCHDEFLNNAENYKIEGFLFEKLNNYGKAFISFENAIKILQRVNDEEHLSIIEIYKILSRVSQTAGIYNKSFEYSIKTLRLQCKLYGEKSFPALEGYRSTQIALKNLEKRPEAIDITKKIIAITSKIDGKESLSVADSYQMMANLLQDFGEYQQALVYAKNSIAIRLKILGGNEKILIENYELLGFIFIKLNNFYEAEGFFKKIIQIKINNLPKEIYTLFNGLNFLQIFDLFNEISIKDEVLIGDAKISMINISSELLEICKIFIRIFKNLGKNEQIIKAADQFVIICKKNIDERSLTLAENYKSISCIYRELEVYEKALEYVNKSYNILNELTEKDLSLEIQICEELARIFIKLNDVEKAILYSEKALKVAIKVYGETSIFTANMYEVVANAYKLSDSRQALNYVDKSLKIKQNLFGKKSLLIKKNYDLMQEIKKQSSDKDEVLQGIAKIHKLDQFLDVINSFNKDSLSLEYSSKELVKFFEQFRKNHLFGAELSIQEGISYLTKRLGDAYPNDQDGKRSVLSLLEKLGYLPLALSNAVDIMQIYNISLRNFEKKIKEKFMILLDENRLTERVQDNILLKWDLLTERIQKDPQGKSMLEILTICALFLPNTLSEGFIRLFFLNRGVLDIENTLKVMFPYQFLNEISGNISPEKIYSINLFVREMIIYRLSVPKKIQFLHQISEVFYKIIDGIEGVIISFEQKRLLVCNLVEINNDKDFQIYNPLKNQYKLLQYLEKFDREFSYQHFDPIYRKQWLSLTKDLYGENSSQFQENQRIIKDHQNK